MKITAPFLSELYDVFDVRQVTRATPLESLVAVDLVEIAANACSQSHRHNRADTVLLMLEGSGEVEVSGAWFAVSAGERIHIPPGAFHRVRTGAGALKFLSVQTPPILDKESGALDLEMQSGA